MTTAPHEAITPQQGANRGHTLPCVHPDAIVCLKVRHDATPGLAALLGGCPCPCHSDNGKPVPYGAWVPPGQREPIGTLRAIRLEKIEDEQEDEGWLL